MNIDDIIVNKIASNIDLSNHENEIQKAIDAYFKSELFKDRFIDAMSEADIDIPWEIAKIVSKQVIAHAKKSLKVEFK